MEKVILKTFTQFIAEEKNLHMEHLEDSLFNEGSAGVEKAIRFLEAVTNMLSGNSSKGIDVTVKWDGAPAVFCGIHPETGKFFVGSKSIFNKTPKINYTNADIRKNHKGGLVPKLEYALKYLKKLNIKGIVQGDLMFTPGDIKTENINGENHYTFTPNTITYAIPVDSDFGREINKAKIGIVFHTRYKGKNMSNMKASFTPDIKKFKNSDLVWYQDADFRDTSGSSTLTKSETKDSYANIKNIKTLLKSSKKFIDELSSNSSMISLVKVYGNSKVREGNTKLSAEEFKNYINDKMQDAIDKLKTDAAKKKKDDLRKKLIGYLTNNSTQLDSVFALHGALTDAKILIVKKLEKIKSIGTFIRTDNGFDVTAPEGFVAVDRTSNKALKLVDRLEFSMKNFNVAKNWT